MAGRFSELVENGPWAQPGPSTKGTESFPGVKRPGRGSNHPPPTYADVKERLELYLYSLSGTPWQITE